MDVQFCSVTRSLLESISFELGWPHIFFRVTGVTEAATMEAAEPDRPEIARGVDPEAEVQRLRGELIRALRAARVLEGEERKDVVERSQVLRNQLDGWHLQHNAWQGRTVL